MAARGPNMRAGRPSPSPGASQWEHLPKGQPSRMNLSVLKHRFLHRRKLRASAADVTALAKTIRELLAAHREGELRAILHEHYPADLADVMQLLDEAEDTALFALLDPVEAAEVLDEVDGA